MKQLISFALVMLLLLSPLVGCKNNTSSTDNSDVETTVGTSSSDVSDTSSETTVGTSSSDVSDTSSETTADNDKKYKDVGVFAPVLAGSTTYYERGREEYVLKDSEDIGFNYTEYTMLDMDGDGEQECLLRSLQRILILCFKENEIHGHTFGFRAMDDVYKNGTFSWHGFSELDGSESHGLSRITAFTSIGSYQASIWRIDAYASDAPRYYIGEDKTQVTKAEFDAYRAQYDAVAVEWKEL